MAEKKTPAKPAAKPKAAAKKVVKKAPEIVVGPHWAYLRKRGTYRATENEDGSATIISPSGSVRHVKSWAEIDEEFFLVPAGDATVDVPLH